MTTTTKWEIRDGSGHFIGRWTAKTAAQAIARAVAEINAQSVGFRRSYRAITGAGWTARAVEG